MNEPRLIKTPSGEEVVGYDASILTPPEFGAASQLLDEIRALINQPKYDHLAVSELLGVLQMVHGEYLHKWLSS